MKKSMKKLLTLALSVLFVGAGVGSVALWNNNSNAPLVASAETEAVVLNLNGDTQIHIPAGESQTVVAEGTPDLVNFTGKYIITWDSNVTDLVVNSGRLQNGGIFEHPTPMQSVQISFGSASGAELDVVVNIVPYVEPLQQVVLGNNSAEVLDTWNGVQVELSKPGSYTISYAEGETIGVFIIADDFSSEMIDLPYNVTLAEGESVKFTIATANYEVDTIDFVVDGVPADGVTLTIEEVLALDIEAVAGNKYYVEGTVVRYSDPYKGGLYIVDEAGNELCIYGLKKVYPADEWSDGFEESFALMWYSDKPLVGSKVKFYGEVGTYDDKNQFVDAEFEILEQAAEDPEANLPEDGMMLSIEDILAMDITTDTLRTYYVEGTLVEIKDSKYGNVYIEDDNGNRLYVYGLYDISTGARFDKMDPQPQIGEIITLKSVVSIFKGEIQLKNARLTECRPAPIALNLEGETVIDIAEGNADDWEYVYVNAVAYTDEPNAQYTITWDESVTNLMVNYGMVENGGILTAYDGVLEVSFYAEDFAALNVTVTLTPYVAPPLPELALGENAIEVVDGWTGVEMQVSAAGEYTLSWAEGEENGVIMVEGAYGAEMLEMPYSFTVEEGEVFVMIVTTGDWAEDEVNVVLTLVHDCADNDKDHACDLCGEVLSVCETYTDATCQEPAKCVVCGAAKDETLGEHNYVDGTCSVCGGEDPAAKPEDSTTSEKTEEPKEEPSILDKVTGMIPGCSGVVGGIAGGVVALGVAVVALLKKKEDNE